MATLRDDAGRPLRHAMETNLIARHLPRKRTGEERRKRGHSSFLPCERSEVGELARGAFLPRDGAGVRP